MYKCRQCHRISKYASGLFRLMSSESRFRSKSSTSFCRRTPGFLLAPIGARRSTHDNGPHGKRRRNLSLMDFPEIIWPSPVRAFRNWWFAKLIRIYYDSTFSIDGFLEGASQAISYVSECLSQGNFTEIQTLIEPEAFKEIQNNYGDLSESQRSFLAVRPQDIFYRFIYEIGMMFDDSGQQRFVEITVVFQGFHGFYEAKEKDPMEYYNEVKNNQQLLYVCNYRFIREFTKGVENEWTINKLNHFLPKEFLLR